jgi:hypothetical protein
VRQVSTYKGAVVDLPLEQGRPRGDERGRHRDRAREGKIVTRAEDGKEELLIEEITKAKA